MIEGLRKAGCSLSEIADIENTPKSTIQDTCALIDARPKGESLPRSGRPSVVNRVEERSIIRFVRQNVRATYAEIKRQTSVTCSHRTISRIIAKHGIKKWLAKKRPLLTSEVAKKRLKWCKKRLNWTVDQWRAYIWSDECSVEIGAEKRPDYVFRTSQQKWDKDMIQPYGKSKACTVMVWAAFCGMRRSQLCHMPGDPDSKKGGVTAAVYLEVLQDELPTL